MLSEAKHLLFKAERDPSLPLRMTDKTAIAARYISAGHRAMRAASQPVPSQPRAVFSGVA